MDIKAFGGKCLDFLKKYRYPVLVLLAGIVLMTLPGKQETQTEAVQERPAVQAPDMAEELKTILGQIKGVGKVSVLLTQAAGESYVYQYDEDVSLSDGSSTTRKDTVVTTDSDRNQQPLLSQVLSPVYQGAVIVCQGAYNASVRLAVVEAVSKATGLSADKITVLEMK